MSFATNSDFLIPMFSNRWYFKLWILFDQIVEVWNNTGLGHQVAKKIDWKIWVFGKISVPKLFILKIMKKKLNLLRKLKFFYQLCTWLCEYFELRLFCLTEFMPSLKLNPNFVTWIKRNVIFQTINPWYLQCNLGFRISRQILGIQWCINFVKSLRHWSCF